MTVTAMAWGATGATDLAQRAATSGRHEARSDTGGQRAPAAAGRERARQRVGLVGVRARAAASTRRSSAGDGVRLASCRANAVHARVTRGSSGGGV